MGKLSWSVLAGVLKSSSAFDKCSAPCGGGVHTNDSGLSKSYVVGNPFLAHEVQKLAQNKL